MQKISAVAVSSELGVACSGATDGVVLLHSLGGELLRSLCSPDKKAVQHLHLSALHLRLIFGCASTACLHVYSLSGSPLFNCKTSAYVRCALVSEDGTLFAGCVNGELKAWTLIDGCPLSEFAACTAGISALSTADNELLCGTQEGELLAYALAPPTGTVDCASWAAINTTTVTPAAPTPPTAPPPLFRPLVQESDAAADAAAAAAAFFDGED